MASKSVLVVFALMSLLSSVALHTMSISTSFQERVNEKEVENFISQLRTEKGVRGLSYSPALHQLANAFSKSASAGVMLSLDQIREEVNRAGYTRRVHSLIAWGTAQDVKQEWAHTSNLRKLILEPNHHEVAVSQEANTWIALFGAESLSESAQHDNALLNRELSFPVASGVKRASKPDKPDSHSKPTSASGGHGSGSGKTNSTGGGDHGGSSNSTGGGSHGSPTGGGGHGSPTGGGGHGSSNSTDEPFAATSLSNVEKISLALELFVIFLVVVWLVAATVLGGLTPERVSCLHK